MNVTRLDGANYILNVTREELELICFSVCWCVVEETDFEVLEKGEKLLELHDELHAHLPEIWNKDPKPSWWSKIISKIKGEKRA